MKGASSRKLIFVLLKWRNVGVISGDTKVLFENRYFP